MGPETAADVMGPGGAAVKKEPRNGTDLSLETGTSVNTAVDLRAGDAEDLGFDRGSKDLGHDEGSEDLGHNEDSEEIIAIGEASLGSATLGPFFAWRQRRQQDGLDPEPHPPSDSGSWAASSLASVE